MASTRATTRAAAGRRGLLQERGAGAGAAARAATWVAAPLRPTAARRRRLGRRRRTARRARSPRMVEKPKVDVPLLLGKLSDKMDADEEEKKELKLFRDGAMALFQEIAKKL